MWFQDLWTPLTGVLFTFPSRYLFTIGRSVVFSLTRWSWQIQTGLHVSRLTWVPRSASSCFRVRGCHALWRAFPGASASFCAPSQVLPLTHHGPTADPQPQYHLRDIGLGCSRFARHYYGNHSLFSFPQGTEMFHFPWFACTALCIQAGILHR